MPGLQFHDAFERETRRIEVIEGHMRVLCVLPKLHQERQITLLDEVVCLADIAHRFHEQTDMLYSHSAGRVTVCDIVTGKGVELGAKETCPSFAGAGTVPTKTHQIDQKPLQLRRIVGSHDHCVPEAALTA